MTARRQFFARLRGARRWPAPDLLHRPGRPGPLGRCCLVLAWLCLAGLWMFWYESQAALRQAQRARDAAQTGLQDARVAARNMTAQPNAMPSAGALRGTSANAGAGPDAATAGRLDLQAQKVMAGLRHAWAGVLLPLEAVASEQVRWLELDAALDEGRLRLVGQTNTLAVALDSVQTLSSQRGWSQVMVSKTKDGGPRDAGVRFELTAVYRAPAPLTRARESTLAPAQPAP